MAWPTTDGTQGADVAVAWVTARDTITRLKQIVTAISASSPIDSVSIVSLVSVLGNAKTRLTDVAAVNMADLTKYARTQIPDQTFDAAIELPAVRAAVNSLLSWFLVNIPQDVNGYLLLSKFNANGGVDWRQLIGAQETSVKAQLTTFLNALY